MELLEKLCAIRAASGNESALTTFLLDYIKAHKKQWVSKPKVFSGDGFQDCIVLVFGKPKTAIFAHLDSIGFNVKYGKELIKIGGPRAESGYNLVGTDHQGEIECSLKLSEKGEMSYAYKRLIDRGTILTFKPNFRQDKNYVKSPYMDNRLGVWSALKVAETLENGIICFSCWEEHGSGSVEFLASFIYKKHKVKQALISDITWVTPGVKHGKGVAISMRDSGIPRRSYVNRIIEIAEKSKIPFQIEVEDAGGSDGNAIQRSPFPIDWCFIGAPEDNVHTPDEKVHRKDIDTMVALYKVLMKEL
ncbi:MAG: M20/M25/M40 family metallo-hydrolase [Bacteroidetes bacterium]|nr:M20/M25/M40 family metallo-hydrolase [Bacteroidota bacterium]